jgi:hypothetical protein
VVLAISGVALQLDGNQTDNFILKGGLDKATNSIKLQQGEWEMFWSNTAYRAQCNEHSSTQWQ